LLANCIELVTLRRSLSANLHGGKQPPDAKSSAKDALAILTSSGIAPDSIFVAAPRALCNARRFGFVSVLLGRRRRNNNILTAHAQFSQFPLIQLSLFLSGERKRLAHPPELS
jgi:hypothetical protein